MEKTEQCSHCTNQVNVIKLHGATEYAVLQTINWHSMYTNLCWMDVKNYVDNAGWEHWWAPREKTFNGNQIYGLKYSIHSWNQGCMHRGRRRAAQVSSAFSDFWCNVLDFWQFQKKYAKYSRFSMEIWLFHTVNLKNWLRPLAWNGSKSVFSRQSIVHQ